MLCINLGGNMGNSNVNMSVNDCLVCKCKTCNKMVTDILNNSNSFISLQNGYYLNMLNVETNSVVISINNGTIYIIRRIYIGLSIKLCIPNTNCSTHTLTITLNSITN